jgi:hypothetical protein
MNDDGYDIMVEIDALLDTRVGSIARLSDEAAAKTFEDMRYYTRENDDFESFTGLTKAVTDKAYAERDSETLASSIMTQMVLQLDEIAKSIYFDGMARHIKQDFKIEINLYPYEIRNDEAAAIAAAVKSKLTVDVPVMCVYLKPEEVSPSRLRASYSGIILYNFQTWLTANAKAIERSYFPRVTVLAPRLYVDKVPPEELKRLKEHDGATPFTIAKLGFAPHFTLIFMHASVFSIISPKSFRHKLSEAADAATESDAITDRETETPPDPEPSANPSSP